jgi:hypothetical protein
MVTPYTTRLRNLANPAIALRRRARYEPRAQHTGLENLSFPWESTDTGPITQSGPMTDAFPNASHDERDDQLPARKAKPPHPTPPGTTPRTTTTDPARHAGSQPAAEQNAAATARQAHSQPGPSNEPWRARSSPAQRRTHTTDSAASTAQRPPEPRTGRPERSVAAPEDQALPPTKPTRTAPEGPTQPAHPMARDADAKLDEPDPASSTGARVHHPGQAVHAQRISTRRDRPSLTGTADSTEQTPDRPAWQTIERSLRHTQPLHAQTAPVTVAWADDRPGGVETARPPRNPTAAVPSEPAAPKRAGGADQPTIHVSIARIDVSAPAAPEPPAPPIQAAKAQAPSSLADYLRARHKRSVG